MSDNINQSAIVSGIDYETHNSGTNENYANNMFDEILETAIFEGASDIHIEPFQDYLLIRIRVDGELREVKNLSIEIYPSLSTLIKLKALMDITEKRLPQDGRIHEKVNNQLIDIRVSTILTIYGEKIVLRLLNLESFLKEKSEIGFSDEAIKKIDSILSKKAGILLVTGPTGSGKTTTVYSILNSLKQKSKNIMTIENPVEYKMDGISQIEVNTRVGLTFDVGLRSILRQDPDIIMIGEIRDIETAKIAVRAAITGHLVIATLHTNDAISSITRLIDMDIKPYLLNASIIGVISQKLVKKVCTSCGHDIVIQDATGNNLVTKVPIGCEICGNKGYIGRTAVYEVLEIDETICDAIKNNLDSNYMKKEAIKNGMITFEDTCKNLITKKITTIEECAIITGSEK